MTQPKTGHVPTGPLDPVAEQVAAFFAADPTWQALTTASAAASRKALRAATPVHGQPAMLEVVDIDLPVHNGKIALRHHRPSAHPSALFVWLHGGGFMLGSNDETGNFARFLAKETNCSVVTVEYRLAPEHKFPTALEDALAAIEWVGANRATLVGRELPLIVGGDSAGGNLATVATRKLHTAGGVDIAANVLAYPPTDVPDAASLDRFEPPFLSREEAAFFTRQYLPDATAAHDPDFAPLLSEKLSNLPPTLLITAEHDIFTEQAEAYGSKLRDCGVTIKQRRYAGMIHGFLTNDFFFSGTAGEAVKEIERFIDEAVEGSQ